MPRLHYSRLLRDTLNTPPRRAITRLLAACCIAWATGATAADFPTRTVTILVGFPPGTSADTIARVVAEDLSKKWRQTVVVENRAGAGGSIAAQQAKRAVADGLTLLLSSSAPMGINPHLNKNSQYDPLTDFAFITQSSWLPYMLVANANHNFRSFDDIRRFAQRAPDALTYATIGVGTTSHLLMEMVQARTGLTLRQIPYQGSAQAQTGLIGGHVDLSFDTVVSTLPHVQIGALTAIAVSTRERAKLTPDVPTLHEQGVTDMHAGAWLGFFAPAATPEPILVQLFDDISASLRTPEVNRRLEALGSEVVVSKSRQAFREMVVENYHMWGDIVRRVGISQ